MGKKIVIVGGGFAGVAAIKKLLTYKKRDLDITLIDRHSFQVFQPSLYELATSEEPKRNIALPYREMFGKRVNIVTDSVEKIDTAAHVVTLKTQEAISYDYLIITLGSETAYYNIEGLMEYSVPLKSIEDAVKIRDAIKNICCKNGQCKRKAQVVIGGGGFSGTELAAEMLTYKNRLSKQFHLDPDCLEVTIIQGSDRLLNELDPHVSQAATKRIKSKQVHFAFGGHIQKVTKDAVFTDNGKSYPYDILIWTGGVKANSLATASNLPVSKRGQILVDMTMRVKDHEDIFAGGDIVEYIDPKTNEPAPTVAQVAEDEGMIAGENVYRRIANKPLVNYHFRHWGYIVPIKGRFASAELMGWLHFDGILGWALQQLVFLQYLLKILTVWKAFRRWNRFELAMEK